MKMKLAVIAVMALSSASAIADVEIDITNDPNKDFFIGYHMNYRAEDCEVIWFASQWNREYLTSIGDCKGVNNDRAYQDLMNAMKEVKSKSSAKNFAEFEREIKKAMAKEREENAPRCLDTSSGTYLFAKSKADNKPGWFYLTKIYNGGRLRTNIVGYWKETTRGGLIADLGLNVININMANVYQCQN